MKYLVLIFTLIFSVNTFADYRVYATQNQKINIPEKSGPWEAPSGEPALHPNGVTVTCLDMPDGSTFNFNDNSYRVVYDKSDAKTYAESACTSNVTDLSWLSLGTSFNFNISHWDTSNVTSMSGLFSGAYSFNQDISDWDVSNVTNMISMFNNARAFNIDISKWNVANVTTMGHMFYYANSFNQDLSGWCVENISSKEINFDNGAISWVLPRPNWNNCPE